MFPLLIPLAAAGALIALVTNKPNVPASDRVGHSPTAAARVSALETFSAFVRQKMPVPPRVLELAAAEAMRLGDPNLAAAIARFGQTPASPAPLEAPSAPTMTTEATPVVAVAAAPAPMQSPIPGVDNEQWSAFAEMLAQDTDGVPRPLTYAAKKRVGRYAASKTRLTQIGIDPETVKDSADAQDAALAADLAEVHSRLVESGTLHEYVGKLIELPDVDVQHSITLSGLLGVVSVAGLEGTVGWLTNAADRKRFPHNTNLFLRTNGAF